MIRVLLIASWPLLLLANSMALGQDSPDEQHPFLQFELPIVSSVTGLPEHDDKSLTTERVNLGRKLFFDRRLSADGSTSCATCHQPEFGFSIAEALPKGVGGKVGRRNPPALINRRFGKVNFWDGRTQSLEDQALEPIENELELATTVDAVLKKLESDVAYRKAFEEAFDDGITDRNLAIAIAAFEKVLLSGNSPIDGFVTAKVSKLTKSQRQGLWLYESKGGCWQCHAGKTYTDESFHNTGVSWGVQPVDLGRFEVTADESHRGQFKTPTLRDVALTAPYMHDGSIKTLREVVQFYNKGGNPNPHLDRRMKPLSLSDDEVNDLVEFLKALTGEHAWDEVITDQ